LDRSDIVTGVTASTGAAADIIGGSTLHSWAGIRLGEGLVYELFQNMSRDEVNDASKLRFALLMIF
jgi:hypothetical protein